MRIGIEERFSALFDGIGDEAGWITDLLLTVVRRTVIYSESNTKLHGLGRLCRSRSTTVCYTTLAKNGIITVQT